MLDRPCSFEDGCRRQASLVLAVSLEKVGPMDIVMLGYVKLSHAQIDVCSESGAVMGKQVKL
jgi:hypothetical protein